MAEFKVVIRQRDDMTLTQTVNENRLGNAHDSVDSVMSSKVVSVNDSVYHQMSYIHMHRTSQLIPTMKKYSAVSMEVWLLQRLLMPDQKIFNV